MTRPKNVEEQERNRLIKEGIDGVKSGLYKSYTQAAKALGVPRSTMTHRKLGRATRVEARQDDQLLTSEEETELL